MKITIARWYASRPAWVKVLVSALYWYFLAISGAVIEKQVQGKTTDWGLPTDLSYFGHLLVGVLVLALAHYSIRQALLAAQEEDEKRADTFAYAASLIDQYVAESTRLFESGAAGAIGKSDKEALFTAFTASQGDLERTVRAVYQVFESKYGESKRIEDRIDFEVTFMTRSYHDRQLTIPAYANRTGRAPRSMLERASKPGLYNDTVTAECYRDGRPHLRVIEDTASTPTYKETYSGQKERIRSSLVCPVLSSTNQILGTLVVHCNKPRFFMQRESKFWRELLERFTARLAATKSQLDTLYESEDARRTLDVELTPPF